MGPSSGLVLLLGAFAPPAAAIEVQWEAPAGCPDREALRARLDARVGPDAQGPAAVHGTVVASPSGYVLALELAIAGSSTQRTLEAATCDELVDAAALIVAVALDPVFAVAEPSIAEVIAAPEAAPTRATTRSQVAIAPTPVEPPTRRRPTLRTLGLALRPTVGVWFGAVPRAAATIGFDVVFPARRSLRAELGVLAIPRQRVAITGGGANLWLASAVLRACFAPAVGRVRPMGCAGIGAGAIGGRGFGDGIVPSAGVQPWAAITGGAGLGIALTRRFEIVVRGEGHIHLHQPGFHLEGIGSLHRVGATSVTALAGLQAVLP
ncbi:MAG TPA: hypothetical protein VG755_40450 [Nannocystaceae bacterium]|nr:hypothetical protein [Nannocystaceae bacterium]